MVVVGVVGSCRLGVQQRGDPLPVFRVRLTWCGGRGRLTHAGAGGGVSLANRLLERQRAWYVPGRPWEVCVLPFCFW